MDNQTKQYLEFAYFSLTERQKKSIEIKWKVQAHPKAPYKEIAKVIPVSKERIKNIINYELPEIDRQLNNWYQEGTVMFNNARGEIVYEYLPE